MEAEVIIEKINTGRATEYLVSVFDSMGDEILSTSEFTKSAANAIGKKWLSMAEAIGDYKAACGAIDEAYTEEGADQCRINAQLKHDAVYTLATKLGIDSNDIDLSL